MKTSFPLISVSAIIISLAFSFQSCSKLKDELFPGFEIEPADIHFKIPVIASTSAATNITTFTTPFNMDSLIQAETMNTFSIKNVDKITMHQVMLRATDGDDENNFSNFEQVSISLSSNAIQQLTLIGDAPVVPDEALTELVLAPQTSNNIIGYMNGTALHFTIAGKARRITSKPITCIMHLRLKIQ